MLSVSGSALKSPSKKLESLKKIDQSRSESPKTELETPRETDSQRTDSKMEVDGESCLLVDIPLSQYEAGFYVSQKMWCGGVRLSWFYDTFAKTWKSP